MTSHTALSIVLSFVVGAGLVSAGCLIGDWFRTRG